MYPRIIKRIVDLSSAVALLLLLSWLFLLIAVVYHLNGYSKVIFRQRRIGLYERTFTLFKFRTLSENDSLPLHQREFPLGSFLRRTSLDELPQLWNILKGEMSFIGPRPLPVNYLHLFSEQQRRRHFVRPGISGWAQVNGRNSIDWHTKFLHDLFYVDHLSLSLDVKIFVRTILLLLSFQKDVSLQEEQFGGNA